MSAGFYRVDPSGELLQGTSLTTPTGVYVAKDQAQYTYPIDGAWRWFDSEGEALAFFSGSPPAPKSVSIAQAKLALLAAGLLDKVDTAVANADRSVQIVWEYATRVERNSPLIDAMQGAVGLSDEQIDALFLEASRL